MNNARISNSRLPLPVKCVTVMPTTVPYTQPPVKRATVMPVTVPRKHPPVNSADIVKPVTMAISKPVKRALPDSTLNAKQRSLVAARIQERRDAVAAKLKRPTQSVKVTVPAAQRPVKAAPRAPASTSTIPSKPSRATPSSSSLLPPPPIVSVPASIEPIPSKPSRHIPGTSLLTGLLTTRPLAREPVNPPHCLPAARSDCHRCRLRRPHRHARGVGPYCQARPHHDGELGTTGYGTRYLGRGCPCHGPAPGPGQYWSHPNDWSVSPAEALVVDPNRPRRVQFNETVAVRSFPKWYWRAYGPAENSTDPATIEDDERQCDEFNST